jgi:predicted nucleic acid-binding protein
LADVERARDLVVGRRILSTRDAIHIAVMERHTVNLILSFDAGFDSVSGIVLIHE